MKNTRIMALDYGDVRIGIAFSDLMRSIASPYETYKRSQEGKDLMYLAKLANDNDAGLIVIGLPLNMDGSEGDRAKKTRRFGDKLSKSSNIKVEYMDERLTSVEAEEILIDAGMRRDKRKNIIDKLAASLILKSYLNKKK